jgi:SecY interacting protein Syd
VPMNPDVTTALKAFISRYEAEAVQAGTGFPRVPYDAHWISACQEGNVDDQGLVGWRPLPRRIPADFSGIEHALEVNIHADIIAFYGSFWSGSLEATCKEGHVSLIQLWNQDDFDRLVENLIGHALAKRRAKQPLTVFFANTEFDSPYFLSVDNTSGEVLLEEPGTRPKRKVDDCLADFLDRLEPSLEPPGIH